MAHAIQVGDTLNVSATFFARPEEDLDQSVVTYALRDFDGVVYLTGTSGAFNLNELPSGEIKLVAYNSITIPPSLNLVKPKEFQLYWTMITPDEVAYFYSQVLEISPVEPDVIETDIVELKGTTISMSVHFPNTVVLPPVLGTSDISVPEGALATFNFTLDKASDVNVSVNYVTVPVTALPVTDFVSISGTLTIPAGNTTATLAVQTVANLYDQANKRFLLELNTPVGVSLETQSAVCTILNDEVTLVSVDNLVVDPATQVEAVYTVTLSIPSQFTVTVDYRTYPRNASQVDFIETMGTLTFAPLTTTQQVSVPIVNPASGTIEEAFLIVLSNPQNVLLSNNYVGITDFFVYDNTCLVQSGNWSIVGAGKLVQTGATFNPAPIDLGLFNAIDTVCGFSVVGSAGYITANTVDEIKGGALILARGTNNTWTIDQYIQPTAGQLGDLFGFSVKFYSESVVIVGAPNFIDPLVNPLNPGMVFVFERQQGGSWNQVSSFTLITDSVVPYSNFGFSIDVDGDNLIVSSIDTGLIAGTSWIYTTVDKGLTWQLDEQLVAPGVVIGDGFGVSTGISGNYAVVGSDHYGVQNGAVMVFENISNVWTYSTTLIPGDTDNDVTLGFGFTLAIKQNMIIVGSPGNSFTSGGATQDGAVYVFGYSGTWSRDTVLYPPSLEEDTLFGITLGLDKNQLAVGSVSRNKVAVYDVTTSTVVIEADFTRNPAPTGVPGDTGLGIALSLRGNNIITVEDTLSLGGPPTTFPSKIYSFDSVLVP